MSIKKSYVSNKGLYKVTFSLPVASMKGKKNAVVLGDFNQWDGTKGIAMKAGKTDFSATIDLKPGVYQFRYLIDNMVWENDHTADDYVASPFAGINNSVLKLPTVTAKASAPAAAKAKPAAKPASTKTVAAKKPATPAAPKAKAPAAPKAKAPAAPKAKAPAAPKAKAPAAPKAKAPAAPKAKAPAAPKAKAPAAPKAKAPAAPKVSTVKTETKAK